MLDNLLAIFDDRLLLLLLLHLLRFAKNPWQLQALSPVAGPAFARLLFQESTPPGAGEWPWAKEDGRPMIALGNLLAKLQ